MGSLLEKRERTEKGTDKETDRVERGAQSLVTGDKTDRRERGDRQGASFKREHSKSAQEVLLVAAALRTYTACQDPKDSPVQMPEYHSLLFQRIRCQNKFRMDS